MKRTVFVFSSLAVILAFFLNACGPSSTPAATPDVNVFYTQAAATIMAGLTETSIAQPSATPVPPSATLQPSATPAPSQTASTPATQPAAVVPASASSTPLPVDPATAHGCYNATLVADITIVYAPTFKVGDTFTKTWRIKNTGSCDWPRGFKIAFVSGDRFGADTTNLDQKVLAGAVTDISLAMKAPNLSGVVNSNWQLTTDIGKPFGPLLSVAITLPGVTAGTATSGGCLNSVLVSDVTVPSGSELVAGDTFTKTWLVKNTGTCTWNRDFKITFVGGDLLGSDTTKIRQIVEPGASVEISLSMTAPASTGTVSSSWQMASDDGKLFGQLFTFSIVVK